MSTIINRMMDQETVTVEVYSGYDGQGKPSFSAGVAISAGVLLTDAFIIGNEGAKISTPLTLYIPPGESVTPGEQDRVTLSDSRVFTVVEVSAPRRIMAARSAEPDHTRCQCTKGG